MIFHKKIEDIYKAQLFARCDDSGLVKYFSHEDFPGMKAEPYSFTSARHHLLKGYFYSYEGANTEGLIIFEHGFGGGHRSYMKEIERLCAAGYRVFAYDHTGCMESEGEGAGGFSQSLCDLDHCLRALKADPDIKLGRVSVMGHSWGGYSTLNISALHPEVEKIVVLSGVVSVSKMIEQNFRGILRGYRKHIYRLEADSNPDYADYDAAETLSNSDTRALLIYSDNDKLIKREVQYDHLLARLSGRENVTLMLTEGKGHNPNYTYDAVAYLGELGAAMKEALKLKTAEERAAFRASFDWHRMTAQDDEIWARILGFLSDGEGKA